jgi:hypothetical protein
MKKLYKYTKKITDPDWMFKPLLNTNTRTNYDGSKIEQEWLDEFV